MAQVAAPGSTTTTTPSTGREQDAPHGIKRAADSALEHEQRLSKRFDLLNLVDDNGTRLYIGLPSSHTRHAPSASPAPKSKSKSRKPRTPRPPPADTMHIEDTPHRVYIHDLAAELSDVSSDEDTPIFLPDIEKHLAKIPRLVLQGPEPKATEDNQLVLYNVPASLSVPVERDGVRKAIVEARRRIREAQVSGVVEVEGEKERVGEAVQEDGDGDAMDID